LDADHDGITAIGEADLRPVLEISEDLRVIQYTCNPDADSQEVSIIRCLDLRPVRRN
jgi:hypothetical protein